MTRPCLKLTTRPGFLVDAMLDLFDTAEVATSVMLRGLASVGPRHVVRTGGQPAHRAVCDPLYRHGFSCGAVYLSVDGTAHGVRYQAASFSRNVNVPLMIISVGTAAQASAAVAVQARR